MSKMALETGADYEVALALLRRLQHEPLGTRETEVLEGLTEAIDEYERRHGVGEFAWHPRRS